MPECRGPAQKELYDSRAHLNDFEIETEQGQRACRTPKKVEGFRNWNSRTTY